MSSISVPSWQNDRVQVALSRFASPRPTRDTTIRSTLRGFFVPKRSSSRVSRPVTVFIPASRLQSESESLRPLPPRAFRTSSNGKRRFGSSCPRGWPRFDRKARDELFQFLFTDPSIAAIEIDHFDQFAGFIEPSRAGRRCQVRRSALAARHNDPRTALRLSRQLCLESVLQPANSSGDSLQPSSCPRLCEPIRHQFTLCGACGASSNPRNYSCIFCIRIFYLQEPIERHLGDYGPTRSLDSIWTPAIARPA
jgi:hypothetical protein